MHSFWAQGLDATRRHLAHNSKLVSSSLNLNTPCCAEVPVCHSSADLRCKLFRCLLRLAVVLNVFSGASLTLHEVNGQAGDVLLAALMLGAGGGLPAAAWAVCGCCWFMVGVGLGFLRGSIGVPFSDLLCQGSPSDACVADAACSL